MLGKMFVSAAAAMALVLTACSGSGESDPMFNETAEVRVFSAVGYSVAVGSTLQLEGRASTWGGVRVDERINSWSSSSPSIATVSNTGLVTGLAVGSTLITAHAPGVSSEGRLVNVTSSGGGAQ